MGGSLGDGIAHTSGFIDTRFSKVVGELLADLVRKAQKAGRFI